MGDSGSHTLIRLQSRRQLDGLEDSLPSSFTWLLSGDPSALPHGVTMGLLIPWALASPKASDSRESTTEIEAAVPFDGLIKSQRVSLFYFSLKVSH